jgi:hypothetical protein
MFPLGSVIEFAQSSTNRIGATKKKKKMMKREREIGLRKF